MRYFYIVIFFGFGAWPIFGQNPPPLSENDKKEIVAEAQRIIEVKLSQLLNSIASDGMGEMTRKLIKANSFIPSESQIFDINAVIEDDTNPEYSVSKKGTDVRIQRYLDNLDLFYTKSAENNIVISDLHISDLTTGPKYSFILVNFKIQYKNAHRNKPDMKYAPIYRTAELKVDQSDTPWKLLITGIRYNPDAPVEVASTPATEEVVKPKETAQAPKKETSENSGYKFEDAIVGETRNVNRDPLLIAYHVGDAWGLLINEGQNKKILTQPVYCEIEDFGEGLAVVCKDGRWGYINTNGAEVNCCKYDNAESYIKGKAKVQLGVKSLTIDLSGKEVVR